MIGSRLGRWVIDAEIGRGAMGAVYLARAVAEAPAERAAVKVLSPEAARGPDALRRFQREIETLRQLDHPNIVRLYESGVVDGRPYYVMEYVEGPDADALLRDRGRLPWPEVLDLAVQVTAALKHAHDHGVIHRDLKPSNLLIVGARGRGSGVGDEETAEGDEPDDDEGERGASSPIPDPGPRPPATVKLTDFGAAKALAQTPLTQSGHFVGTVAYLAPEQAAGKPASKRSDFYSLGGVLFTLLTGRPPFDGQSAVELMHKHAFAQPERVARLVPELPHDIDELVAQLLAKDPQDRPADGSVLLRQLERIRGKLHRQGLIDAPQPVADDAPEVDWSASAHVPARRAPGLFGRLLNNPLVLSGLLLVCIGLIVWGLTRPRRGAEELYAQAEPLIASSNPDDWERAWSLYLLPLRDRYPDRYRDEVAAVRQKIDDRAAQRAAIDAARSLSGQAGARAFYQRGLQQLQGGDVAGARAVWSALVRAFRPVESERRWVKLAEDGLGALDSLPAPDRKPVGGVPAALARARALRDAGHRDEAEQIWQALQTLYGSDPAGRPVLDEIRRDREAKK
jgi:serine/threonine protein kinase